MVQTAEAEDRRNDPDCQDLTRSEDAVRTETGNEKNLFGVVI